MGGDALPRDGVFESALGSEIMGPMELIGLVAVWQVPDEQG
jgi:hypothetical protein